MINTIHSSANNNIPAINKSKNGNKFLCRIMNSKEVANLEKVLGLERNTANIGIKVNGYAEVDNDDILDLLGRRYRVIRIKTDMSNQALGKFRKDYNDFTGSIEIALAGTNDDF